MLKARLPYILFFCLLSSSQAEGVQFRLDPKDVKEAIRYGTYNKDVSHPELVKAWRIDLGYGVGSATVITPYASLIILGKESALKHREPTDTEIHKELEEKSKHLDFGCGLYGEDIDFATKCKAVLEIKGEKREPLSSELPSSASYTRSYPASPKYWALCFFHFSLTGINPDDQVTLVIKNAEGKELKFPFDLSKLK